MFACVGWELRLQQVAHEINGQRENSLERNADQQTKTIELHAQGATKEQPEKAKVIPLGKRPRRGRKQIFVCRDGDDENLR